MVSHPRSALPDSQLIHWRQGSTVISRYRLRWPCVSTDLSSMDMLLVVTVFSSTSPIDQFFHRATSIGEVPSQHSFPLEIAHCGATMAQIARKHTISGTLANKEIHRRAAFCTVQRLRCTTVCKGPIAATCQSTPASLPSNQRKETHRLGDRYYCEVSEIAHSLLSRARKSLSS